MEVDYKYQTEYAKSNRSTCRACKLSINQGSLRMAVLVQSSTFDGKMPLWFHFHCFFKKSKVISTSDIKNFDGLKFEDQEKIRNAMKTDAFDLGNFGLKRLGESKDKCTSCSKVISDPFFVDGKKRELGTAYHVKCFVKKNPSVDMQKISGLSKLNAQDKADLLDAVANVKPASNKRPNSANGDQVNTKKAKLEDPNKEALRKQSEHMWKLHNALETEVTKEALVGLLEYNDQHVPTGLAALLDAVVDGMVFGALPPCPACKNCSLTYSNGEYRCMGMASEWARCIYTTREPKRRPFRVPKEYHDATVLRTFKYKPRTRIFAATDDNVQAAKTAFSKKTPLGGLNFLIGKGPFANDQTARDIASTVKKLGGAIILEPSNGAILITSEEEIKSPVETRRKFIERASYAHMRPICVRSLDLLRKAKSPEEVDRLINENLLSDWRSGSNTRSAATPCHSSHCTQSSLVDLDRPYEETRNALKIEYLMRLFEFCQQTFSTFAGETYEQIMGTPMGSPVSDLVAELVLQELEKIAFIQHEPVFWRRYVDDTFVIVKKDILHSLLNAVLPDIKFMREEGQEQQLPFLDVLIRRNLNGEL
ncbi:Poly [ADP-ribose] polymerase 1 [Sparganum proliferum]